MLGKSGLSAEAMPVLECVFDIDRDPSTFSRMVALGTCMVACQCEFGDVVQDLKTAQRLVSISDHIVDAVLTHVRESLATSFDLTYVWLFTRVGSMVDGQGTPLDEALTATGYLTAIRSLIGVNAIMSLQVRLAIESLLVQDEEGLLAWYFIP